MNLEDDAKVLARQLSSQFCAFSSSGEERLLNNAICHGLERLRNTGSIDMMKCVATDLATLLRAAIRREHLLLQQIKLIEHVATHTEQAARGIAETNEALLHILRQMPSGNDTPLDKIAEYDWREDLRNVKAGGISSVYELRPIEQIDPAGLGGE